MRMAEGGKQMADGLFLGITKLHFVGIGGAGMRSLAEVLARKGLRVSGSDLNDSEGTRRLRQLGVSVSIGHDRENLGDAEALVYSVAVPEENPELRAAREQGLPLVSRAEMLGELMRRVQGVGVAGTHGKTTTTSMVGGMLIEGGLDPTVIVGGETLGGRIDARMGRGEFLVAEADEFDRSFLHLMPVIAVVTSLEPEHMDCYRDLDDLMQTFVGYLRRVPFYGTAILGWDDPNVRAIASDVKVRRVSYGTTSEADIWADEVRLERFASTFVARGGGEHLGRIRLNCPGMHNVRNALAAVAVGQELGIAFRDVRVALELFRGVRRRFEIKGRVGGVMVVDDYAHHPTEVRATLEAARSGWPGRILAVFQPHLYSRTRDLHRAFGEALALADVVLLTDVYPAREEPIPGVTGEVIVSAARDAGHPDVTYVADKGDLAPVMRELVRPGDLVLTMGAGDVWRAGEVLLSLLG